MFNSPTDTIGGKRPVIFDILGPDRATSLLPPGIRLVLHVNPTSMKISYSRKIERIQTRGGFVEQHWGDRTEDISFEMASGGLVRLYSGMSNTTSSTQGGSRRDTIAYDKYLDLLALYHNNGSIYDARGEVVLQGIIKITFDGGVYLGWFANITITESADKPYQLNMSASFTVDTEVMSWRSSPVSQSESSKPPAVI
jgi:hypothetical protein